MDLANVSEVVLGLFIRITLANDQDSNHELFAGFVQRPHNRRVETLKDSAAKCQLKGIVPFANPNAALSRGLRYR